MLDSSYHIIDIVKLNEGSVNQVSLDTRKLVELTLRANASMVVLAHNHPGGIAVPSAEDVATTNFLYHTLLPLGVTLIDHVIVGKDTVMPILNRQQGNLRPSPITGKVDEDFYRSFYGKFDVNALS